MGNIVGIYLSEERSETNGGVVVYGIGRNGERRFRVEIAPDMVEEMLKGYGVSLIN